MAKAILHTDDLPLADRRTPTISLLISTHGSDILFSHSDEKWRFKRRLCATELFSTKRLQALSSSRTKDGANCPIVLSPKLMDASSNIISTMLMSKPTSDDSRVESLVAMRNEGVELVSKFNVGDYISSLGWMNFFQGNFKCGSVLITNIRTILQAIMDERRLEMKKVGFETKHDLLQVMLENMEMSEDNDIKGVLVSLITAGVDITASTIEWALAALLGNLDKMKRLQHELDEVIGNERRVQEDDIQKLPYLQAIVKEDTRLYPVAPLLLLHLSRLDFGLS